MTTDLVTIDHEAAATAIEHILATGDLAKLSAKQRVGYYLALCQKLSLASESRPFDWLTLDGRLVLYPNKSCAEQLRRQHQISVKLVRKEISGDLFVCEVEGSRPNGQTDFASKYVPLRDARGTALAGRDLTNAYAKAETGAKRRLTFSMVGLAAVPDVEDLRGARVVTVDGYGNVIDQPTEEQRHLASRPAVARVIGEPTFETTAQPSDSPLQQTADQAPTAEELERPSRQGPPASFKPTKEDVERWRRKYFATTKGTSLYDDHGRATFIRQWTAQYPEKLRTDSLVTFLSAATARQASDLLAHVRVLAEEERRALLADLTNAADDPDEGAF